MFAFLSHPTLALYSLQKNIQRQKKEATVDTFDSCFFFILEIIGHGDSFKIQS